MYPRANQFPQLIYYQTRHTRNCCPPLPFFVKGIFLVIMDKDTGLLDLQTAVRIHVLNQEQGNKKDAVSSDLDKQMLDSLSVRSDLWRNAN